MLRLALDSHGLQRKRLAENLVGTHPTLFTLSPGFIYLMLGTHTPQTSSTICRWTPEHLRSLTAGTRVRRRSRSPR
jgi:hypothetical protein